MKILDNVETVGELKTFLKNINDDVALNFFMYGTDSDEKENIQIISDGNYLELIDIDGEGVLNVGIEILVIMNSKIEE